LRETPRQTFSLCGIISVTLFDLNGVTRMMKDTQQARFQLDWLWYGIFFLFFFQLLTDFVAAVYAFGLLGVDIPPELITVLVLFAPIVLVLVRHAPGQRGLFALMVLVLLTGLVELMLDTRGRMLVAGIGVGGCLVFLPALLYDHSRHGETERAADIGLGVSVGLALSICFRAWNSGVDPAPLLAYRVIEIALAISAGGLFWRYVRQPDRPTTSIEAPRPGFFTIAGLALGLVAALTLLYFAFTSPSVIARWTDANYLLILGMVLFALIVYVVSFKRLLHLLRSVIMVWNVIFVIALSVTLLAYQIYFPASSSGYPLPEPLAPAWSSITLILTCLLFPVILLDLTLYSRELIARRPSLRALGGAFTLGSLFLLIMIFAQVFTTVYDYIPVVGPLLRDRFWLVFCFAGIVMLLPLVLVRRGTVPDGVSLKLPVSFVALVVIVALVGAVSPIFFSASVTEPDSLRVLTYNIQQGYDAAGQLNYAGQLALMRNLKPDIIGLQETDTNRIAGGNSDLVRYFADHLGYYSYYGPKTVAGTFGIALLSRYPIDNPRTIYLYSEGEQTAAIIAQINGYNVVVTHLGNDGPIVQQQNLLQEIDGLPSVLVMGDFNFKADTDQYRLTRTKLDDAWLLRWPQDDAYNNIDHLFVTPGVTVKEATYLTTPDSDHPALLVEIGR
jgi:endonuclease/exonuclease/phosphatase family metal-dependent hydrolase